MPRAVLSVNARSRDRVHGGAPGPDEGLAAFCRRTDFGALQEALGAEVVDWESADVRPVTRWLRRKVGFGPAAALLLWLRRDEFDSIWCFTEVEGLLFALLLKLSRARRQVFVIGVELLSWKCLLLLRWLRVWTHLTVLLPTNTYQAGEVVRRGRVPPEKVIVLPYQVDCEYFRPDLARRLRWERRDGQGSQPGTSGAPGEGRTSGATWPQPSLQRPYIVAVGLESRDYETLAKAVADLDVEVRVAAASLWAGRTRARPRPAFPDNMWARAYAYEQLRELYAGACLAVVPLHQSIYQHGVTAIQEAMAMGLPVVATRTVGQGDVLTDRRQHLRGDRKLGTKGGFADLLAPGRPELARPSGHYVAVGDASALRRSISYLLEHPGERDALGAQGRLVAEQLLSLDKFVFRATRLVTAGWEGAPLSQELLKV